MKYLLYFILLFSIPSYSLDFSSLKKYQYKLDHLEGTKEDEKCFLSISDQNFKTIDIRLGQLNEKHPLYVPTDENSATDLLVGVVDLTGNKDTYYLVLSWGASYDISYYFYRETRLNNYVPVQGKYIQPDFQIEANSIIIPSNGEIYSYGHNDHFFNTKKKFLYLKGSLSEVKQDLFFYGAKSISLKDQTAYTTNKLKSPAFQIKKGDSVTVIGLMNEEIVDGARVYIVASDFGLVGYLEVEPSQSENQFSGLYWNGD